jgi:hypothetical protein
MVEKWQVLWVLQDGSQRDAKEIREKLQQEFRVESRLNSLRKNLQRCHDNRLLKRPGKKGRAFLYTISKDGTERLRKVIAKRIDERVEKTEQKHKPVEATQNKKELDLEWLETVNALRLSIRLLNSSSDYSTTEFARSQEYYWFCKLVSFLPSLSLAQLKVTMSLLQEFSSFRPEEEDYTPLYLLLTLRLEDSLDYATYRCLRESNENQRLSRLLEEEKAKNVKNRALERKDPTEFSRVLSLGRMIGRLEGNIDRLNQSSTAILHAGTPKNRAFSSVTQTPPNTLKVAVPEHRLTPPKTEEEWEKYVGIIYQNAAIRYIPRFA